MHNANLIAVTANRCNRIATGLLIVRDVKNEFAVEMWWYPI
jgi:hypothetical protein